MAFEIFSAERVKKAAEYGYQQTRSDMWSPLYQEESDVE